MQLPAAGVEPWLERVRDTPDVQFTSAGGAYATQVAELALGLLIAGVRGFAHYARTQTWDPRPERTLEGSTVAIVGAGGIGRALIDMLEPHDVDVHRGHALRARRDAARRPHRRDLGPARTTS